MLVVTFILGDGGPDPFPTPSPPSIDDIPLPLELCGVFGDIEEFKIFGLGGGVVMILGGVIVCVLPARKRLGGSAGGLSENVGDGLDDSGNDGIWIVLRRGDRLERKIENLFSKSYEKYFFCMDIKTHLMV